jgi:tRNA-dihydrouridine synthase
LEFSLTETPIVAQIWGKNPERFSLTAREISKMNFAGIDINMGCPDKSVVKAGGGAALIKDPELAIEIIKSVKISSKIPVSVKTRIGFSSVNEWQPWLTTLLEQNLNALTVHLRTRKEMSKVSAHHELIPDIVRLRDKIAPNTKLVINGDIPDRVFGEKLAKKYPGIDGFMIGRGVFANPFCFEKEFCEHDKKELIKLLQYHLELFNKYEKEKYEPLKKFFKIYINNFPGAAELRKQLMDTKNTTEARAVLGVPSTK